MILLLIIVFFRCWIDNESWAVWTFFIPVATICFINLCLLTYNWHTLAKKNKNNESQANKQKQNTSVVKKTFDNAHKHFNDGIIKWIVLLFKISENYVLFFK